MEKMSYVYFIHDGGKLLVVVVEAVDGGHGGVEVLDIFGVHDEEGRVPRHDVADPGVGAPLRHTLAQLNR